MSDTDTPSGGTATPETPAAQAAQAAPQGQVLSMADVEKLFTTKLAADRAALQADFAKQQAERDAQWKAQLEALKPGKQPKSAKDAPADAAPPTPPLDEKPWAKDPEWLAQQSKQRELEAKQVEIEKTLEKERERARKAEREAEKAGTFQAVLNELVDVDNPVRADAAVAKTAAELLILRGAVVRGEQDKKLYVKTLDENGQEKTVSLREGVRAWLNGPEGLRFRPALPGGSGSTAGSAYASLSTTDTPMTEADLFKAALIKDQRLRAAGAN